MAIEAPLSRYKKQNFKIIMVVLLGAAILFGYDGYFSKYEWSMRYSFYEEHVVNNGGVPDGDMQFNQKAPPVFIAAAILFAIYYFAVTSKNNIVAENSKAIINGKEISYDIIEKINKTHFDKKGFFTITYTENGQSKELTLKDRTYDNLPAVLDHIVSKIS